MPGNGRVSTMMPFSFGAHGSPSSVTTAASMPGSGMPAEPGLIGIMLDAVRVAEHRPAGLGLPHVIDHRHAAAEHACSAASPTPAG